MPARIYQPRPVIFEENHYYPHGVKFSMYSPEEIRSLSVVEVRFPIMFNVLKHPLDQGLYDSRMGPSTSEIHDKCATCSQGIVNCPGHIGHVELALPVLHAVLFNPLVKLLRMCCLQCHSIRAQGHHKALHVKQMKLLEEGLVIEALQAAEAVDSLQEILQNCSNSAKEEIAQQHLESLFETVTMSAKKEPSTRNIESVRQDIQKSFFSKSMSLNSVCPNCKATIIITASNPRVTCDFKKEQNNRQDGDEETVAEILEGSGLKHGKHILTPIEIRDHLRKVYANEKNTLDSILGVLKMCTFEHPTDVFIRAVIPIQPPCTRPVNIAKDEIMEHPCNIPIRRMLETNLILIAVIRAIKDGDENLTSQEKTVVDMLPGENLASKLKAAWYDLQISVDSIFDSEKDKKLKGSSATGVKQLLEKKEGLFRKHIMGKRVNYAARTVITPDPNIGVDEIGIPLVFAKKLTYPAPVSDRNLDELYQMVVNGPNIYPGAISVQCEDGTVTRLNPRDKNQRLYHAKLLMTPDCDPGKNRKVVHRHLQDGDILLLNRQPTLHKPSIMAHKAVVLENEKTFRMNYANCKSYNADFDGDEMNAHFPQNELARSEAYNLANVSNQYLVPKDGTPLSGLIQDHVVSAVTLTVRGQFLTKQEYQQLVWVGLSHRRNPIKLLPPTIWKPQQLWSGKQVLSTLFLNLVPKDKEPPNLTSNAKIKSEKWQLEPRREWKAGGSNFSKVRGTRMCESEVIIRNGELLCGVFDKTQFGATSFGLVHCFYELYGSSCELLSSLGRIFTVYLQSIGFTLGVRDILVTAEADKKRHKEIKKSKKLGIKAATAGLNLYKDDFDHVEEMWAEIHRSSNTKQRAALDRAYKEELETVTNNVNRACVLDGLVERFPKNNLQLLVESGAKGSSVNTMQISATLGQIELEGKRPPLMISGKALPCFRKYDVSPEAGGFVSGRFMTGLQPYEYFFHCMAGREGLIDTAVKTSRSGYLQRCMIKLLEGLVVNYDMTVRDCDNSIVQFQYGEDGLDIGKHQYLKPQQLHILAENSSSAVTPSILSQLKLCQNDDLRSHKKKIRKWMKKNRSMLTKKQYHSGFLAYEAEQKLEHDSSIPKDTLVEWWHSLDEASRRRYEKCSPRCPDPLSASFMPGSNFGAISEKLDNVIEQYILTLPEERREEVREVLYGKAMLSLCEPGEPVGLLAAQSIGEPSTQMTLNTFHFAGRGDMNVTLGIPRLRELLMMASSSIRTPSMEIPFLDVPNVEVLAEELRLNLHRVTFSQILDEVLVEEGYALQHNIPMKVLKLRFVFRPRKSYKDMFKVKQEHILKTFENNFVKNLIRDYRIAAAGRELSEVTSDTGKSAAPDNENEDDPEGGTNAATTNPVSNKLARSENYESSDEEECNEDDDFTLASRKQKHNEMDYDEPEDDETLPTNGDDMNDNIDDEEDNTVLEKQQISELEQQTGKKSMPERKICSTDTELKRIDKVLSWDSLITGYSFDVKKKSWCELTLSLPHKYARVNVTTVVKATAEKTVVRETPGINRAFVIKDDNTQKLMLKTEGINIVEMFEYHDLLDLNRLSVNDIHAMNAHYGIEAARQRLVQEVQNVFKVYAITIDPRHLLLISDYMTHTGTYTPCNRIGMAGVPSPLLQMSFETTMAFMQSALLSGTADNLQSPSSRIVVGQPCRVGTKMCDIFYKLKV